MRTKGFTLIELAVVLAIIAVLAAILTPIVTNYIDQARVARGMADARVIADAIRLYQRDVGAYPIFDSTAEQIADDPGAADQFIAGPAAGTTPSVSVGAWGSNVATTTLTSYLNSNSLGRSTTATLGKVAFRGPYVGSLEADPWGNRYYVTAANLTNGSANWAFVISAGPNGSLETSDAMARSATLTPGGDDIVVVIR